MANLGLLQGVAEGLTRGFEAYRSERDYIDKKKEREEEKLLKQALLKREEEKWGQEFGLRQTAEQRAAEAHKAELVGKGLIATPEGGFEYTPEKKKETAWGEATKEVAARKEGYEPRYNPDTGKVEMIPIPGFKDEQKELAKAKAQTEKADAALKLGQLAQLGKPKKEDLLKMSDELRKERAASPVTKATQEISASYNKMLRAAETPSPAGDMSLIFGYMKMLDPNSTVREGEYASAEQAASVPSRIWRAYNKAIDGVKLAPEQRSDFMNQAGNIYKAQSEQQAQLDKTYIDLSKKRGISPEEVTPGFGVPNFEERFSKVTQLPSQKQASGLVQAVPQKGEFKKGPDGFPYVFLGGDPADPKAWRRQ